jgi:hypothetical protein
MSEHGIVYFLVKKEQLSWEKIFGVVVSVWIHTTTYHLGNSNSYKEQYKNNLKRYRSQTLPWFETEEKSFTRIKWRGIVSCFSCHSHNSDLCNVYSVPLDITKR